MKKVLLFFCIAGVSLSLSAQNSRCIVKRNYNKVVKEPAYSSSSSDYSAAPSFSQRQQPAVGTNAVSIIKIGRAGNCFGGYSRCGRTILDYNPTVNAVTLTHRACPACTPPDAAPNTGSYMFDYSNDGGTTWKAQQGPIYAASGTTLARYPQGMIFNPSGNTNPDSADIVFHGPSCEGCASGDIWKLYVRGIDKLGDAAGLMTMQAVDSTGIHGVPHTLIPSGSCMVPTGTAWVVDMGFNPTAAGGNGTYSDTIVIRQGVYSTSTKNFAWTTVGLPWMADTDASGNKLMNFSSLGVAFDASGNTGYIYWTGQNNLASVTDSTNDIYVTKTTNGGTTWSAPMTISVKSNANTAFGTTGKAYDTGAEMDGAVDKNGNLHLILGIFPSAGYSAGIDVAPYHWGEFGVYTTDGGTTWKFQTLGKPETWRGTYHSSSGNISEDNRGQIALSPTRDKVFYVWFDTDTSILGANWRNRLDSANVAPNAMAVMFDLGTSWSSVNNLTGGTAADGVLTFGYVAPYASLGNACSANSYNIHLAYQQETNTSDNTKPVDFIYVKGACLTAVNELDNNVFSITDCYPNPATGNTSLTIDMKQTEKVTVEVSNILGQGIYSVSEGTLSTGTHTLTLDASKWNSGVYFYTVKSQNFSITKKLVKE